VCLFGQNSHVNAFNELLQKKTINLNIKFAETAHCAVYDIQAKDFMLDKKTEELPVNVRKDLFKKHSNDTGGLSGLLTFTCGDIVALRKNINHRCGLVTNARGRIVGFAFKQNEITVIFVEMFKLNTKTGLTICNVKTNIIPVLRQNAQFIYRGKQYTRSQFPLALNYANTVHSVQSLTTHDDLILDPKSCNFNRRLFYTGVSRCDKLSNLILLRPFTVNEISKKPTKTTKDFYVSMNSCYVDTIKKYRNLLPVGFLLTTLKSWQHIEEYLTDTYDDKRIYDNINYDIQVNAFVKFIVTTKYYKSKPRKMQILVTAIGKNQNFA
jgi:hypothetical protein